MKSVLLDLSVLATHSRYRGIGRYALMLARGLAACSGGFQVVGLEQVRPLRAGTVTTDLLAATSRLTQADAPTLAHMAWAWSVRLGLRHSTRAVRPALVHSIHPDATPLGPLGCPRVMTLHDLVPLRFPKHHATSWKEGFAVGRRWLDHRRYHRADHLLAVSECSARDARDLLGVPADRISVVYPGIESSSWSPEPGPHDAVLRRRLGVADRPYVLYVGAGDWRKNAEGMMGALRLARGQAGTRELLLVWAGRLSPPEAQTAHELIAHHRLEDAVRLPGFVTDAELRALYRGAVAKLFVSRYEGFGFPIVEAMAIGCPVVTSKGSSTGEVAGDAALLVDPENHPAIAEAVVALAGDESERQRWRARGLARASRFTIERMARDATEVYRAVLSHHRG